MPEPNERGATELVLGRVVGLFGVRGELRLLLYNPQSELLSQARPVVLRSRAGERRHVRLRTRPGAGKRILGTIDGVRDREVARELLDWEILVRRDELPPLEPGSWYVSDLLDLPVRGASGRPLGRLVAVHQSGPVDVWELKSSRCTRYFPVLRDYVIEVAEAGIVLDDEGVVEG